MSASKVLYHVFFISDHNIQDYFLSFWTVLVESWILWGASVSYSSLYPPACNLRVFLIRVSFYDAARGEEGRHLESP